MYIYPNVYISKGAVEMVLQVWHLSPGLMNSVHPEDLLGRRREATAVDCPLASTHIPQHMGTSHHTQKLKNFLRPAAPPKIPILPPAPSTPPLLLPQRSPSSHPGTIHSLIYSATWAHVVRNYHRPNSSDWDTPQNTTHHTPAAFLKLTFYFERTNIKWGIIYIR